MSKSNVMMYNAIIIGNEGVESYFDKTTASLFSYLSVINKKLNFVHVLFKNW